MSSVVTEKHQQVDVLRSIEIWLKALTNPENPNDMAKVPKDIDEICSRISENFEDIFTGLTPKKRATLIITTLNTLIRIYNVDQFDTITSRLAFQSMIQTFKKQISNIIKPNDYAEYFTGMLDLLLMNFAKDDFIVKCLKQFFPNELRPMTGLAENNKQRLQTVISDAKNFLFALIGLAASLSYTAIIQSAEDFNNNYQSLMESLLKFVDDCFNFFNKHDMPKPQVNIVNRILALALSLTDKTPLIPMFIAAKYAEITVTWLQKLSFPSFIGRFGSEIMGIVYNLSRHKKGLKALRKGGTFDILMKCKPLILKTENSGLIESFSRLLIALPRSDDEEKQNEDIILKVSTSLFYNSQEASEREDWRYDGYHLSEYLYSLQGAFSNISIVQHILGKPPNVKQERIKFFAELFCSVYGLLFNQDVDDLEKLVVESLLNIILCISNYEEYRDELSDHVFLRILIESLAKQPKRGVAKCIWWNLQQSEGSKSSPEKSKKEKKTQIYISYNWVDDEFCHKFVDFLRKNTTVPIWVDYEQTDGFEDPWQYLDTAIESATIIIVLASPAYDYSKYSWAALNYAMKKMQWSCEKKYFIIVEIEPNFHFNQMRMNTLFGENKPIPIPYKDTPEALAREVANQDPLSQYKEHVLVSYTAGVATQSLVCIVM